MKFNIFLWYIFVVTIVKMDGLSIIMQYIALLYHTQAYDQANLKLMG
jgi:hypothetical protein